MKKNRRKGENTDECRVFEDVCVKTSVFYGFCDEIYEKYKCDGRHMKGVELKKKECAYAGKEAVTVLPVFKGQKGKKECCHNKKEREDVVGGVVESEKGV